MRSPRAWHRSRPHPPYVQYEKPPLSFDGDLVGVGEIEGFKIRFRLYDYGVLSLALSRPFSGSWADLVSLGQTHIENVDGRVVTLANGDAFAVGGHPSDTDDYVPLAGGPGQRHNNNTPERYSPAANTWTLITTDITAPNGVVADGFPRFRLLPNGLLFTHTEGIGTKRIFDPVLGQWTGPDVDVSALPAVYNRDSYTTSVLLPLLPPNYSARVLACNSPDPTSFLIDIDDAPKWQAAPSRQGSAAGKRRNRAGPADRRRQWRYGFPNRGTIRARDGARAVHTRHRLEHAHIHRSGKLGDD